jgi:hypothetical protein
MHLERPNTSGFIQALQDGLFTYVQHLSFVAPIIEKDQFRCPHDKPEQRNSDSSELIDEIGELMPNIRSIFESLERDNLHSFQ